MKKIFFALAFIIIGTTASAQTADEVFKSLEAVIAKANTAELVKHFKASVELTLPGTDQTANVEQATAKLKKFFETYPPSGFTIIHTGSSGTSQYASGAYRSGAEIFDVNLFLIEVAGKFKVTQIRIEGE